MGYTIPDNDLAAFPLQSQIFETDLSILAAAYAGYRVVSGCAVTAQGTPDMTVAVASGRIRPGDETLVDVSASAALAIDAADATLWRLDLVSVAANGTVTHTGGTAAALTAVKPPALPAGHVALAFVTIPPAATVIDTDQIVDKRPFMASPEPIAPVAHGNLGAAHTFDYADGSAHEGTADAACTVTLAGPAGVQEQILELGITEDGTGGHINSFTWDPSIVWESGTAPTLDESPNAYNLLAFRSVDAGASWYGFTKFGAVGVAGADGLGVPAGGTTGQVLAKASAADNDTHWVDPAPGTELDYVQFTANVSITATTEATANTIVTGNAVSYDGTTTVFVEFFAPDAQPGSAVSAYIIFCLFDGGSSIGLFGLLTNATTNNQYIGPIFARRRLTPASGSHTYSVRAYSVTQAGIVEAGAGGSSTRVPGYIRITKV